MESRVRSTCIRIWRVSDIRENKTARVLKTLIYLDKRYEPSAAKSFHARCDTCLVVRQD